MKIQTAISACIAMLLSGCASYSGNNYRQDIVYQGDGYYDSSDAYAQDDGYYGETYYDGGYDDGYYGGGNFSFGYGYGDPFFYGNRYGYCSPRYAFCPGDPLAVFLFPIGGGRYWLLFDGYDNRSYYYGNGYGYGWPYGWGYPHDRDGDWDHHHRHDHDDDDDDPDPVAVTPPNGWVPSPRDGRQFLTPHPRKGVFTPNSQPRPGTDLGNRDDVSGPTPRDRSDDGGNGNPPMRWRPPPTMNTGPVDGTRQVRVRPDPTQGRIQLAPSDQTRVYVSGPPIRNRPEPSEPVDRPIVDRPTRSVSTPDPQPVNVPNRDSDDDRASRIHRRVDGSGGG